MARVRTSNRRWALQMQQPAPAGTRFDRTVFLLATAAAIWLAVIIAIQGLSSLWALVLFVPVWAIIAYLALPRLHRMLSNLYVPDYFFGRTRTSDGLLGDPVNLGVDGTVDQLDHIMTSAGWHRADEITLSSTWGIIRSTLTRRSYPTAPVSSLMLFQRRHDVAYQQEVAGNPKQRHHVRFWHCPPGWLLPGGAQTDWLGAGTYDTDVGLSFFTLQITHRIDENTDVERDYVIASAQQTDPSVSIRVLHDFTTGYHSRNGGGDRFITDGNLPIIDLTRVTVPPRPNAASTAEPHADQASVNEEHDNFATAVSQEFDEITSRLPLSVAAAVAIVMISALIDLLAVFLAIPAAVNAPENLALAPVTVVVLVGVALLLTVSEVLTAAGVLRGYRWARNLLVILLAVSIAAIAIDYLDGQTVLALDGMLFSATMQCLALLALTSESAQVWSLRRRIKRQRQHQVLPEPTP